jgi:hypothetical protein
MKDSSVFQLRYPRGRIIINKRYDKSYSVESLTTIQISVIYITCILTTYSYVDTCNAIVYLNESAQLTSCSS